MSPKTVLSMSIILSCLETGRIEYCVDSQKELILESHQCLTYPVPTFYEPSIDNDEELTLQTQAKECFPNKLIDVRLENFGQEATQNKSCNKGNHTSLPSNEYGQIVSVMLVCFNSTAKRPVNVQHKIEKFVGQKLTNVMENVVFNGKTIKKCRVTDHTKSLFFR